MKSVSEETAKKYLDQLVKDEDVSGATWMPMAAHNDIPGGTYVFHFRVCYKGKDVFKLGTLPDDKPSEFEVWRHTRKWLDEIKVEQAHLNEIEQDR